ncbi:MAG: PadR family transcriptional regulator [Candidatus Micrarchaeia archaeon]|jgi:DNA-binding PadR family transcriptional regulator
METKAKYSHPEMKGGNCVFLLWLIGRQEAHGYQIIKLLKEEGMHVGANRLYPVLRNMLRDGVISQKEMRDGKRVRKVYVITPKGRKALKESKRLFQGIAGEFAREMLE